MTGSNDEMSVFVCTGGVLAIAGYDGGESPDYATEIDAYKKTIERENIALFCDAEESDFHAVIPSYCASCGEYHSDARPMYAATLEVRA